MDPVPLSVDPIGDFLEARVAVGDAPAAIQQHRARLERFRRAFPGLPLPDLGGGELAEHLQSLSAEGIPPPEVQESRLICEDFITYKNKYAGGPHSERPITKDVPLVSAAQLNTPTPTPAKVVNPYAERAQRKRNQKFGLTLWVLLAAGAGAAYFAWQDFKGGSDAPGDVAEPADPGK